MNRGVFLSVPGPALEPFRAVQDFVDRLVGGTLNRSSGRVPHVTLIYYGEVERLDSLNGVVTNFTQTLRGDRPFSTTGFKVFRKDDGGRVLALEVDRPHWLDDYRKTLFERTGAFCTARQFPTWEPHLTLGTTPAGVDVDGLTVPEHLHLAGWVNGLELHVKGRDPLRCAFRP